MSGIAGLRGTGDWGTDERPKNFREGILFYQAAGTSPIFALTSKAGKKTVNDPEFSWWSEGQMIIRLQVNGALAAGDTLVTVDSADPTSSTPGANYGTATHLKAGDILLVEPTSDSATFNHELIEVDSVLSDTQFTVRRGVGGTTAATIANDVWLLQLSSAYAEGTGAPPSTARNPIKYTNYIQIFKDTYELSGTADKTATRTNNNYSTDKKRKSFKHAADIEKAFLWGRAAETTGSNGKPKRFMGGIRSFLPSSNVTVFSSAVTPASFLDALAPMFTTNTGAGDTRIVFCGGQAVIELSKIFANEVMFNATNVVKVYGMDFQEFTLPMGKVMLKIHPLMSQDALFKYGAFVVDFDALKYVTQSGRPDGTPKDDVQLEEEDVRRGLLHTDCSCMVDYGGLTMGYLGNISST